VVFCDLLSKRKDMEKIEQIIDNLKNKAAVVNSYRANLTMTIETMGQNVVTQGSIVFKKPNKSWKETVMDMGSMGMKQIYVSDGKTSWAYNPKMKIVNKINLEKIDAETKEGAKTQRAKDISKPCESFQRESISYVRTEEIDGRKVYIFQGLPRKSEMSIMPFVPAKIEMWVGVDDGLARKIIVFNEEGKEMICQLYTDIEVNIEVADNQFEFTAEEKVQVIDITEGTINMIKGMKGVKE